MLALTSLILTTDASALDLKIGTQARGGGARVSPDGSDEEYGFDYGVQLNAGVEVLPNFWAGVYGEVGSSRFDVEGTNPISGFDDEIDVVLSKPSAGLHLRANFSTFLVQLQGGYVFTTVTRDFGEIGYSRDGDGFKIGALAGNTFPLVEDRASLDVGVYTDFTSVTLDGEDEAEEVIAAGLALQLNFDLPL